ncbi:MAG: hypothetical protein V4538_03140 [Bacteroidota bacterium]
MKIQFALIYLFLLTVGCTDSKTNNVNNNKNPSSIASNTINESNDQKKTSFTLCESSKILGEWRAQEDEKSELTINRNFLIYKYEKLSIDSLEYALTDKLDSDKANKNPSCYIISKDIKDDITFEYEIVSVSEKTLTLMNLDRGNLLVYFR